MKLTKDEQNAVYRQTRQALAQFLTTQGRLNAFDNFTKDQINGLIRCVVEEHHAAISSISVQEGFYNDPLPTVEELTGGASQ